MVNRLVLKTNAERLESSSLFNKNAYTIYKWIRFRLGRFTMWRNKNISASNITHENKQEYLHGYYTIQAVNAFRYRKHQLGRKGFSVD